MTNIRKDLGAGNSGYTAEKYFGGPIVRQLETKMCELFGCKHAIAVNSGTSGLFAALAIYLYGQKPGREVIVTPFSMSASSVLPLWFGAIPVFADIEAKYFCLDPIQVKAKITKNTVGIIAVDLFGHPYDKQIDKIASDNGLWVIEDAAQAIGATRHGKYAGTLGDIGVLSFNQHKHVSCGEGGMILCDDLQNELGLRKIMNHGEMKGATIPGLNLRMTENNAAIILEELGRLDSILAAYRTNTDHIPVAPGCVSSYYKLHAFESTDGYTKGYVEPIYTLPIFANQNIRPCLTCEHVSKSIWARNGG